MSNARSRRTNIRARSSSSRNCPRPGPASCSALRSGKWRRRARRPASPPNKGELFVTTVKGPTLAVVPAGKSEGAQVLQPSGWPMPKGYANGMAADGRIVVTGGVIGWDAEERLADGFIAQVHQVLSNIAAILAEAGARPEHLVRLTWYVVDMDEYLANLKALGRIYREIFGAHYPAMALVQVVRLVEKAARVEIEATAVVPR